MIGGLGQPREYRAPVYCANDAPRRDNVALKSAQAVPATATISRAFTIHSRLTGVMPPTSPDPVAVVQRQLDAYNARDIEALLAIYAADAELYEHPSKLLATGSASLRERFAARFREPNLHAKLLNRIATAHTVIDHELVTRTFPEGPGTQELTMIYEVNAGRIARAWSILGTKTVHG
jgi:hypothetical protein